MESLEKILSDFNVRTDNTELIDYMSRTNLFDTIGKSRNEMTHSRILKYLLSSKELCLDSETPMLHLLDAIVSRDMIQNKLDADLKQNILTRSLSINEIKECEVEFTLGEYVSNHSAYCTGFASTSIEKTSAKEKDRLDLYINMSISGCKRKCLELFIENKVYSEESDLQTKRYYDVCQCKPGKGNNKHSYKLFVYLTPVPSAVLLDDSVKTGRPECDNYIGINYQDILDFVISPLLANTNLPERVSFILKEYVNCLELPALPDTETKNAPKGFSIMATSAYEKRLVDAFMENESNRILLNASVALFKKNGKLYQVGDKRYLSSDDAIVLATKAYVKQHSKWESVKEFSDIIGNQGGTMPFLIYRMDGDETVLRYLPNDCYSIDNEPFMSYKDAFIKILPIYLDNGGQLSDFNGVYDNRGGGRLFCDTRINDFEPCINSSGDTICYVNPSCENKKEKINEILKCKPNINICQITSDVFDQLAYSNKWHEKYPQVPSVKYRKLEDTGFYYRKWGADINKFINKPELGVKDCNQEKEYKLLRSFYNTHKSMIISIKKILLDEITDVDQRANEEKILRKMFDQ